MDTSIELTNIFIFFIAILTGAIIPGVSVMAVVSTTLNGGLVYGASTIAGIVSGDIILLLLTLFGLSVLAESMASMFVVVKYLGALYLLWFGVMLWRSKSKTYDVDDVSVNAYLPCFYTGLFITLGDQKAVMFYMSFLPMLVNVKIISFVDTLVLITITIITVAGVKLGYALMAVKITTLVNSRISGYIKKITSVLIMGLASYLIISIQ